MNQPAFKRTLELYMHMNGCSKQVDLLRKLELSGHPYTAPALSLMIRGERTVTVEFMLHVVYALQLTPDQENALIDAYLLDLTSSFWNDYMDTKSRLE